MNFKINEPLNYDNPLIGQIPQMDFRTHTKIYLKQVNEHFKLPVVIIIYGSIARGQGTAKSDLDILFLIKNKWNKNLKNIIMEALYKGAVETQLQAKPLFKTVDEFIKSNETITKNIKKDGIIIKDTLDSEPLWKTMMKYWNITT
jgi:predicted nucleotidyltransferase